MNADALKAFLRLGLLIAVLSGVILFVQTPGTPEFIVTILSLCIGVTLVALVLLVARSR